MSRIRQILQCFWGRVQWPMVSRVTIGVLASVFLVAGVVDAPWVPADECLAVGTTALLAIVGQEVARRRDRRQWDDALRLAAARRIVDQLGVEQEYRSTLVRFGRLLCEPVKDAVNTGTPGQPSGPRRNVWLGADLRFQPRI
jgi:hypothetical protein